MASVLEVGIGKIWQFNWESEFTEGYCETTQTNAKFITSVESINKLQNNATSLPNSISFQFTGSNIIQDYSYSVVFPPPDLDEVRQQAALTFFIKSSAVSNFHNNTERVAQSLDSLLFLLNQIIMEGIFEAINVFKQGGDSTTGILKSNQVEEKLKGKINNFKEELRNSNANGSLETLKTLLTEIGVLTEAEVDTEEIKIELLDIANLIYNLNCIINDDITLKTNDGKSLTIFALVELILEEAFTTSDQELISKAFDLPTKIMLLSREMEKFYIIAWKSIVSNILPVLCLTYGRFCEPNDLLQTVLIFPFLKHLQLNHIGAEDDGHSEKDLKETEYLLHFSVWERAEAHISSETFDYKSLKEEIGEAVQLAIQLTDQYSSKIDNGGYYLRLWQQVKDIHQELITKVLSGQSDISTIYHQLIYELTTIENPALVMDSFNFSVKTIYDYLIQIGFPQSAKVDWNVLYLIAYLSLWIGPNKLPSFTTFLFHALSATRSRNPQLEERILQFSSFPVSHTIRMDEEAHTFPFPKDALNANQLKPSCLPQIFLKTKFNF